MIFSSMKAEHRTYYLLYQIVINKCKSNFLLINSVKKMILTIFEDIGDIIYN